MYASIYSNNLTNQLIMKKLILLSLFIPSLELAKAQQAPSIAHASQTYKLKVNQTTSPIAPINTGGTVPAQSYCHVTTVAGVNGVRGNTDGNGANALFSYPQAMTKDKNGNIYVTSDTCVKKISISNWQSNRIFSKPTAVSTLGFFNHVFTSGGITYTIDQYIGNNYVSTKYAGTGNGYADGNRLTQAKWGGAMSAVQYGAYVYVTDGGNRCIRRIDTLTGYVSTFTGKAGASATTRGWQDGDSNTAKFKYPVAITAYNGFLYVLEKDSSIVNARIRKVDTATGSVTTIIGGNSSASGYVGGVGTNVNLGFVYDLKADNKGNLFLTENYSSDQLVKKIRLSDNSVFVLSTGNYYGGNINDAEKNGNGYASPAGIEFDNDRLLIADFGTHRILTLALTGWSIRVLNNNGSYLPNGLKFDSTTGTIYGTPTQLWKPTQYIISGYNSFGESSDTITISVGPNLGNDTTVFTCPGFARNISTVYNTIGYQATYYAGTTPTGTPLSNLNVGLGNYTLVLCYTPFSLYDTAIISVALANKPNLGKDTSVNLCKGYSRTLLNLYDTAGLSTNRWNLARPDSVTTAGTYSLIVTNNYGCKDTALATLVLKTPSKPILIKSGANPICSGDSVLLSVTNNGVYQWFRNNFAINGTISNSYKAKVYGSYYVLVTDSNSCKAYSDTLKVSEIFVPTPKIAVGNPRNVLTSTTAATYQWYKDYTLIQDINTQTLQIDTIALAHYSVKTVTPEGCKSAFSDPFINLPDSGKIVTISGCDGSSNSQIVFSNNPSVNPETVKASEVTLTYDNVIANEIKLQVFPNPSSVNSRVKISGLTKRYTVLVSDITGRIVWQYASSGSQNIALPNGTLKSGVYTVTVKSDNQQQSTKWIVN